MNLFFANIIAALIQFSPIAILLLALAYFKKSYQPLLAGGLLFSAFLLDSVILNLRFLLNLQDYIHPGLRFNWQGKFIEFLWPLIIVGFLGKISAKEIGFSLPKNKISFLWVSIVAVLYMFGVMLILYLTGFKPEHPINIESTLFEFTMPGLGEELVYRGIFLAILNSYLKKQWVLFNTRFGWGLILISILFILIHCISYNGNLYKIVWTQDLGSLLIFSIISFGLGFIKEKTGSVWPAVLFHNLINGLYDVMGRFLI